VESDIAIRLRNKIEDLIARFESLKSENRYLAEKVDELSAQNEIKTRKINALEKKLDNLQLTGALTSTSGDNAAAKRKVASLIREIDKCIGLLND